MTISPQVTCEQYVWPAHVGLQSLLSCTNECSALGKKSVVSCLLYSLVKFATAIGFRSHRINYVRIELLLQELDHQIERGHCAVFKSRQYIASGSRFVSFSISSLSLSGSLFPTSDRHKANVSALYIGNYSYHERVFTLQPILGAHSGERKQKQTTRSTSNDLFVCWSRLDRSKFTGIMSIWNAICHFTYRPITVKMRLSCNCVSQHCCHDQFAFSTSPFASTQIA